MENRGADRRTSRPLWLCLLLLLPGCRTVVTTTTEVRPSRYAVVEFTRAVARDSALAYAVAALKAENLKIQQLNREQGSVVAGPMAVPAENGLPALQALITVTTSTSGSEVTVRITSSATLEPDQTGGTDPRLRAIVERIRRRIEDRMGS